MIIFMFYCQIDLVVVVPADEYFDEDENHGGDGVRTHLTPLADQSRFHHQCDNV